MGFKYAKFANHFVKDPYKATSRLSSREQIRVRATATGYNTHEQEDTITEFFNVYEYSFIMTELIHARPAEISKPKPIRIRIRSHSQARAKSTASPTSSKDVFNSSSGPFGDTMKDQRKTKDWKVPAQSEIGVMECKYFKLNKKKFPIKPIPYSDLLFTRFLKSSPCNVRELVQMKLPFKRTKTEIKQKVKGM